jgi:nitroimidazol reductase NimA-like FMN-containing flavoprotein (pyridoxamine 5'-phosphate oxidase superfamily)
MAEIQRRDSGEGNVDATRGMSYGECRVWLDHHSEGVLGYIGGRGPRSIVVTYAVTDDQILFLVPAYNEVTQYVPGKQVTLQVAGESSGAARWHYDTVSVTGTANLPRVEQTPIVRRTNFVELWPPGVSTSVICLPMAELEGSERQLTHA